MKKPKPFDIRPEEIKPLTEEDVMRLYKIGPAEAKEIRRMADELHEEFRQEDELIRSGLKKMSRDELRTLRNRIKACGKPLSHTELHIEALLDLIRPILKNKKQ